MIQCRVKPITEYKTETVFRNPKCGHVQKFDYCSPLRCQEAECLEMLLPVDKLYGPKKIEARLKFFAEGKIGT